MPPDPPSLFTLKRMQWPYQYKIVGAGAEKSISKSLESANRALSLFIAKAKSNGRFSLDIFSRIFDATVTPIIEFNAHLWAFKECPKVN